MIPVSYTHLGMMDTILNLGMNDQAVEAVAKRTGNPRFAWDSYRLSLIHIFNYNKIL